MAWKDWIRGAEIEPSIYAADFARLGDDLGALLDAGAKIFQFDVGDGHFVEPVTIGPIVLQAISPLFRQRGGILDVHLMVDNPEHHFEAFARAGADSVTAHFEIVGGRVEETAAKARDLGLGFGLAVNPETPIEADTTERVRRLGALLPAEVPIQVDGGVGEENIQALHQAGATLFVAGSSVFDGVDPPAAYRRLADAVS